MINHDVTKGASELINAREMCVAGINICLKMNYYLTVDSPVCLVTDESVSFASRVSDTEVHFTRFNHRDITLKSRRHLK